MPSTLLDKPRVAAIGMFDGVHLGHQALIAEVADIAASRRLISSAITFSSHPLSLIRPETAPRLLTSPHEKIDLLHSAGAEDVTLCQFTESLRALTAAQFMSMIAEECNVSTILMGFNHRFGSDGSRDFAFYQKLGQDLGIEVLLSSTKVELDGGITVSSTAVRRAIADTDMELAAALLGRPYSISGTVARGLRIGHSIGFPTANLLPDCSEQLIPPGGAYAATAVTAAGTYPAMVNIGCRPTIAEGLAPTIEAHLIDYEGDLYGAPLTLHFRHYLRPERHFPTLAALAAQLRSDRDAARQLTH